MIFEPNSGFSFEAVEECFNAGGAFFMNFGKQESENDIALLEGKLLTVFGEPEYLSDDYEDGFRYSIKAEKDGRKTFLDVYLAGDVHIGANLSSGVFEKKAAEALIELVNNATPSDYERTRYYIDAEAEIHTVVKDGKVTITTRQLSPSEAKEIIDRQYGEFADDEDFEDFEDFDHNAEAEDIEGDEHNAKFRKWLSIILENIDSLGPNGAKRLVNDMFGNINPALREITEEQARQLLLDMYNQICDE